MKDSSKALTCILTVGVVLGLSFPIIGGGLHQPTDATLNASEQTTVTSQSYTVPDTVVEPKIDRGTYEVYELPPEVQPAMIPNSDRSTFTNDPSWDVQWPFPVGVTISSGFGYRDKPCAECSGNHQGLDFAITQGTPIQTIARGTVTDVGWDGDYGYRVIIEHIINGEKIISLYGHLVENSSPLKPGDVIRKGTHIGDVGNTGASTGPHLHLEIRTADGVRHDPYEWLQTNAGKAKAE